MTRDKKSRLWEQPAEANERLRRGKDRQSFLISENAADVLQKFTRLRRIAETRQNPTIKNEMLRDIGAIFLAYGEQLQANNLLYKEIAKLKESDRMHRKVVESISQQSGIDPNIEQSYYRQQSIIIDQLESLKRKGLLDD